MTQPTMAQLMITKARAAKSSDEKSVKRSVHVMLER
jgi:hypothetical protein